ncbi:DUF6069 family protein [Nonomuraea sp. 10N515B]|uniref:DUF6069 family protein n=1 Tax=Nonomuraea sp. 10N515B TaxID=3457422 RepID=UPI003FCC4C7F
MITFATPPATQRRKARLLTVLVTILAALIVWGIAVFIADVDITASYWASPTSVVVVSGVAGLAGWATLAAIEHWTARAARIWTLLAIGVFVFSLVGPIGTGSTSAQVAMAALHLTVAAILIPGLRHTSVAYPSHR